MVGTSMPDMYEFEMPCQEYVCIHLKHSCIVLKSDCGHRFNEGRVEYL